MKRANPVIKVVAISLLCIFILSLLPQSVVAAPVVPPPDLEVPEYTINTGSAGIATGDPDAAHARYGWPFAFDQMGHLNSSYQLYSSNLVDAYFHHGIDMLAAAGTAVRTPCAGQVVNIENYSSPSELYWEVAIRDSEGYVWQYHHLQQSSIPQAIHQAFTAYQADHVNGGFISANAQIGNIVPWPEVSFGFTFNHVHLNILAAGDIYLNPLEFLDNTYVDTQAPQIQAVGLFTGTNKLLSGNTIPYGTDYSLYIKTRDLFMSQVFYLPPQRITYKLDGSDETHTVWNFHNLPGGDSDTNYVNQYFLPGLTQGNYDERVFYIDLGFAKNGINPLPTEPGLHSIDIEVWDFAYNRATWKFNWIITQTLPDNGCVNGHGVSFSMEVDEDSWIEDIDLGLVVAHENRGQVKVSLKGPMDSLPTVLIEPSADANLNYNILIDDASVNPINNNRRDDLTPAYFKRIVGPVADGSLDYYINSDAKGTWKVFICDSKEGISGAVYDVDLQLSVTNNLRPTADDLTVFGAANETIPMTLSGYDPEGEPLTFTIQSNPSHGILEGEEQNLFYTPDPDFVGTDSFTFIVNDGEKDSLHATVTIKIYPKLFLPIVLR